MDKLASYLTTNKVYWYRSIFWRNTFARLSVFYTFMLEGIFMGVWSCYLPHIQSSLDLSDSELGLSVLFVYLGTVMVSPFTAFCLRKLGSKWATYLGAICFGVSLCFIAMAKSFGILILTMFVYGWSMAKPLLGSFHGSYSVAAAIGSLVGGALVGAHYGILAVFTAFSIVSVIFTSISSMNMYNFEQEVHITRCGQGHTMDDGETDTAYSALLTNGSTQNEEVNYSPLPTQGYQTESSVATPSRRVSSPTAYTTFMESGSDQSISEIVEPIQELEPQWRRSIDPDTIRSSRWTIAFYSMVGFLAAFGESSIVTWSIVYFDRTMHASSVMKSLGFTAFMISMAVGRFMCDYMRRVLGRRLIVRISGLLAMSGLALVVASLEFPNSLVFACIGFSITGLGLSTLIPTVFSSAGHIPGVHAGSSIATVAGFSYSGSIVSSPLVGLLSDSFGSLRYALLCDAILLGIICPLSWGIPEESHVFLQATSTTQSSSAEGQENDTKTTAKTAMNSN